MEPLKRGMFLVCYKIIGPQAPRPMPSVHTGTKLPKVVLVIWGEWERPHFTSSTSTPRIV